MSTKSKLFLVLFLITLIKIGVLYINKTPLWVDEAQYWFWSKFPDTGYYSKPPVIAWIIGFFTKNFGDNIFWIRFPAPLIHFATAIYIYLIASKLYYEKVGFYSAISYLLLPAVTFSSYFISTDAPLMLCWAGAFYHFISATQFRENPKFSDWIAFALWLGLGMLSKYTMILFLVGIGLHTLNRSFSLLFTSNFWFSLIFAGLIFLPNILWNSKNNFASFHHTQENLLNTEAKFNLIEKLNNIDLINFIEFIGGQIIIFSPIFFIFSLFAIFKKIRGEPQLIKEDKKSKVILLYISIPVVIAGLILALISGAQMHWIAPAYIALTILVCWYLIKKDREFWIKLSIYLNIIISLVFSFATITSDKNFIRQITNKNPFERIYIWQEITDPVKKVSAIYKNSLIASDERKIIAPLTYNLRNGKEPKIIYKWNGLNKIEDHFDLKFKLPRDYTYNVIFITRNIDQIYLRKFFSQITLLTVTESNFRIYLLNGQK